MNRLITLILGLFMFSLGVSALVTGESYGFSSAYGVARPITYADEPIEFLLVIIFDFGVAIYFIKYVFKKDDD